MYRAFICLVSLDYVSPDQMLDKMVQVHSLTHEIPAERGYGVENVANMHFKPTNIRLNETESSFVIYGDKGIFVGNFPAMLQN